MEDGGLLNGLFQVFFYDQLLGTSFMENFTLLFLKPHPASVAPIKVVTYDLDSIITLQVAASNFLSLSCNKDVWRVAFRDSYGCWYTRVKGSSPGFFLFLDHPFHLRQLLLRSLYPRSPYDYSPYPLTLTLSFSLSLSVSLFCC